MKISVLMQKLFDSEDTLDRNVIRWFWIIGLLFMAQGTQNMQSEYYRYKIDSILLGLLICIDGILIRSIRPTQKFVEKFIDKSINAIFKHNA